MMRRIKYAIQGLVLGIKTDRSIRFHFIVALIVFIGALLLQIPSLQWAILILTIFFVIVMEYVNSAIESFADRVHPEQHFAIKKTKDLAAAGVFLSAICALLVGLLIFLPPLIKMTAECCLSTVTDEQ